MAKKKAAKKKTKRKTKSIITGYMEKVSGKVFTDYSKVITDMIKGHQGIYALYKNDRLYYVGLASNLKGRIKQHLRDKHKGQWTHFSLYIVRKTDHIKEIESMILRIAYPKGNAVKGKLAAKNLRPLLKNKLKAQLQQQVGDILGKPPAANKKISKKKSSKSKTEKPLKGLFPNGKRLFGFYKGYEYRAWVFRSGTVKYDGQLYDSPSGAGKAARGGISTNGWSFWKFKDKTGDLVKLRTKKK